MSFMGVTDSFRLESLQGIHNLTTDVLRLALYTDATGPLDATTTVYTTTGETTGAGYTAGGEILTVATGYPQVVNNRGQLHFNDVTWAGGSFSALYGLIYNTTQANRAVAVLYFGQTFTGTGSFTVNFSAQAPFMQV